MKRLSTILVVLCFCFVASAAELNIYASGLSATQDGNTLSLNYILNAPATALELQLLSTADNSIVKTIPITGAANFSKGSHSLSIYLADHSVPLGTYKWALKATGEANSSLVQVSDDGDNFTFFGPRGLDVDIFPESPWFGNIYIDNSGNGDGDSDVTDAQTEHGIYIYNPLLEQQNEDIYSPYQGGLTFVANTYTSPFRICVGPDGMVYFSDPTTGNEGVYMMNPADPSEFVRVLALSSKGTNYNHPMGIDVQGIGADRKLYMFDAATITGNSASTVTAKTFAIGENNNSTVAPTYPFVCNGTGNYLSGTSNRLSVTQTHNSIHSDGRGGFWGSQLRDGSNEAKNPGLFHINAAGQYDFYDSSLSNSNGVGFTLRGQVNLNADGSLLGVITNKRCRVYSVAYNETTGVPSLTLQYETPNIAKNVDGVAFDYADNLYVASAGAERLKVYATPKVDNSCTTPAKQASTITVYPELNIYAYGLNAVQNGNVLTVDYSLNAHATALELQFLQGESVISTLPITGETNFTRGAHTLTLTLPVDLPAGNYTWAMKASGTTSPTSPTQINNLDLPKYQFYAPRGMAICNNPEFDYFGNIYVTNTGHGNTGTTITTKNQEHGFYIFNQLLELQNPSATQAYAGGIEYIDYMGPNRPVFGDDGMIYFTDRSTETVGGVYVMNPANPTANFERVIKAGNGYTAPASVAVTGRSSTRKIYVLDNVGFGTTKLLQYTVGANNGSNVTPNSINADVSRFVQAFCQIESDKRGGFWAVSWQGSWNTYNQCLHINASGEVDLNIKDGGDVWPSSQVQTSRGAMALNKDATMIAVAGNPQVFVYGIDYSGARPQLTLLYEAQPRTQDTHIDALAFDYAGNLYVASSTTERMYIYATPKAENACITPAKRDNTIVIQTEPNIYAFGLTSEVSGNDITFHYSLNTKATAVEIQLLRGEEVKDVISFTDAEHLAKGSHSYTYNLSNLPAGNYTWAVKAAAEDKNSWAQVTDNSEQFQFYGPRGLDIDNNTESQYFGNLYITNTAYGNDGSTAITKVQKRGIYAFDAMLNPLYSNQTQGLTTNAAMGWNENNYPFRLCVGEDGKVYVSSPVGNKIYSMNPADYSFAQVTVSQSTKPTGIEVVGNTLYVVDYPNINSYSLDETNPAPATVFTAGSETFTMTSGKDNNGDALHKSLVSDGRGGFWYAQIRYTTNDQNYPAIVHINANAEYDYYVDDLIGSGYGFCNRAQLNISADGTLLACATGIANEFDYAKIFIYSVTYNAQGTPTLNKILEIPFEHKNIDGIAFDYANNLYVASAGIERLRVYTLPKPDNTCTTPAAERYGFEHGFIVKNDEEHTVSGVETYTDVLIEPTGKIIIPANASLVIEHELEGADDASKIEILADANGSGNLIHGSTTPVNATVELYKRASNAEATAAERNWQYIGSPLQSTLSGALNDYENTWLMEWDNPQAKWTYLTDNGTMTPFTGYGLTQTGEGGNKHTFAGTLQATENQTISLEYNALNYAAGETRYTQQPGFNLLANSWTAPIQISQFNTSNFVNAEATIYLFNTGNTNSVNGTAGTYTTLSVGTAGDAVIAPMEGFFILANSAGASITLNYDQLVRTTNYTNAPNHLRRANDQWQECVLEISAENKTDKLRILASDNFTNAFDNGYDASKLFLGNTCPQLMAVENGKYLAINALPDFTDAQIAFLAGTGLTEYTLTVSSFAGDNDLYLVDLITNTATLLTQGAEYHFIANNTEPATRFVIERREMPSSAIDAQLSTIYMAGSTLYTTTPCEVSIYAADGRLMQQTVVSSSLPLNHLPSGAYIIRCGNQTLKVIL